MASLLPNYDEVWVISDIHMGGTKTATSDFQIFNRGQRLGNFIEYLRGHPAKTLALVLNGDVIDALAEDAVPGYVALDAPTAEAMMERIYDDPSFSPVWDALADFVRAPGRTVVFVLGNHDIELALTPVERSIRRRLGDGTPATDARIVFASRGGGFSCLVDTARVFCTHGNEVDGWNEVDYTRLAQLDNAINAGRRIDPARWEPNAGTRLVIDVMNKVKRRHPFVDLLKPEIKPVLGVLLALEPELVKEIDFGAGSEVVRELMRGNSRVSALLSAANADLGGVPPRLAAEVFVKGILGSDLGKIAADRQTDSEDEFLIAAELALATPDGGRADGAGVPRTLGFKDIVASWFGLVGKAEGLRLALRDWIGKDTATFGLDTIDETFERIVERVGTEVDFVVTGHTHLARSIEIGAGRHYFNCGTWIRLLRLTPESLADPARFEKQVYEVLRARRMDALDAAKIPGAGRDVKLVFDRTTAVRIAVTAGGVEGALMRVRGGDTKGSKVTVAVEKGGLD